MIKMLYERLLNETEAVPDKKTYVTLLNICGHCGDIEWAKYIWNEAIMDDKVKFDKYVLNAFIDCCARNGEINEMYSFVLKYDENVDGVGWMSLLNACKL